MRLRARSEMKQAAACLLLLAAFTVSTGARAEPARYEIDPEHLTVAFLVDHIGYAKMLGQFRKASGSYTYDEQTGKLSDVKVVVDTASVDTGHERRDEHLRGKDFLNSSKFPQMVFTAQNGRRTGQNQFVIEGELELLGVKRPLALEATLNKAGQYPIGGGLLGGKPYVMGVSARGNLKRSSYGMMYAVENGWVGDNVELIIEFEARRK